MMSSISCVLHLVCCVIVSLKVHEAFPLFHASVSICALLALFCRVV